MSYPTCRHAKEDGTLCQAPALRGRHHCYFHIRVLGRRLRMAAARARGLPYHIILPPLEDLHAVQVGLTQVLEALAAGHLEERRAGLLLYGLQQASTILRRALEMELFASGQASTQVNATAGAEAHNAVAARSQAPRAEEYPGFEDEFELPEGFDLNTPPEVAYPEVNLDRDLPKEPDADFQKAFTWERTPAEEQRLQRARASKDDKEYVDLYSRMLAQAMARAFAEKHAALRARVIARVQRHHLQRLAAAGKKGPESVGQEAAEEASAG